MPNLSSIERCRIELRNEVRLAVRLATELRRDVAEPGFKADQINELAFALQGVSSRVLRHAARLEGLATSESTP